MKIPEEILIYGQDILSSPGMLRGKNLVHHGRTCRYRHSLNVAAVSLRLCRWLSISARRRDMVRGALLHDYYLYDRRAERKKNHLRSHAQTAHANAAADFTLSPVEEDVIRHHMFPITPRPPRSREGLIVCVADKIATFGELLGLKAFLR